MKPRNRMNGVHAPLPNGRVHDLSRPAPPPKLVAVQSANALRGTMSTVLGEALDAVNSFTARKLPVPEALSAHLAACETAHQEAESLFARSLMLVSPLILGQIPKDLAEVAELVELAEKEEAAIASGDKILPPPPEAPPALKIIRDKD